VPALRRAPGARSLSAVFGGRFGELWLCAMALLDPAAWFWMPLAFAVVLAALAVGARTREAVVGLGGASIACVALSLAATAAWSWLLRDGLGPGVVPSGGWGAWVRFFEAYGAPLVIAALQGALTVRVIRWRVSGLRGLSGPAERRSA